MISNNISSTNNVSITDVHRNQTVKRLDDQDPVMADRFAALLVDAKTALKSGQTILPMSAVHSEKPVPRSLKDNLINDVTTLEKTIGTLFKMNDMNGDKHVHLEKHGNFGSLAQVLGDYNDFSIKYFLASNYAQKTGISTMEELQIFTRGK